MKNRKGFTIVELVIVIAVIAILAAVLIPTFSGVIAKASTSAALQEATSAMKAALAMSSNGTLSDGSIFAIGDAQGVNYAFEYKNNSIGDYTENSLWKGKFYATSDTNHNTAIAVIEHGENFNSIIINSKVGNNDSKVLAIIKSALGEENVTLTSTTSTALQYKYTLTQTVDTVQKVWYVFTSEDFAQDVVCFTHSKV